MTGLSVSVVVPLYGGRDIIEACLASIPDDVEVVVVDDGSPDGADEVVAERFPRATLLHNERRMGFGQTANRGLFASTGDVGVVLNSDARLTPGALERLRDELERDPRIGIAGPRLYFPDGSHQLSAASFPTLGSLVAGSFAVNELYRLLRPHHRFRWELGLARRDHDTTQDVDWVHGTCIAIRRECLDATQGFDPAYAMYMEECDLCWRAAQHGWRVRYVADAAVTHIGAASGDGDVGRQARLILAGEARFIRRVQGASVVPRWRAARLLSSAAKVAVLAPLALVVPATRSRLRWHLSAMSALTTGWKAGDPSTQVEGSGPP